ncbi:MAG TPA: hypothetical protein VEZ12_19680, partial [Herpetosiphonaceae bacterium]|nr:hypothetical protein [Herpetosiphonaceae bacterium]
PWSAAALCYWYGRELQRRRREREHDRLLASLPSMPQAKLRRLERWCERRLEEGPNGQHGQQYYQARWLAPHVAQELERPARRAALERTKVRRGRPAPAQTLTNDDAMALFNRTEQSEPRTPEPAAAPPAAVCTPLPVGPTVPTFEPVEPKPAAAASCSQTIVRPDLYRRYAAERRAAAVHQ